MPLSAGPATQDANHLHAVCIYVKHTSQRTPIFDTPLWKHQISQQGPCLNVQACCILYDAVPILSFISTISFAMCVTTQR